MPDTASPLRTQPDLALLDDSAPELPLPGAVIECRTAVQESGNLAGTAGRSLLWSWRRKVTPSELLLDGRTVLGLAAAMKDASIPESIGLIGSHLGRLHDLNEQGIARLLAEIERFCRVIEIRGRAGLNEVTAADARDFIGQAVEARDGSWRDPSIATRHVRRTALRLLYRVARHLEIADGDPTIDVALPPRSSRVTRPLNDDEEALCRIWARTATTETRQAAAWAVGTATGTGSELAAATTDDIDFARARIWLHGSSHRSPRWGELNQWALHRLDERLQEIGTAPETPLLSGARASRNARQASVSTAISDTLTNAGLRSEPGVRPSSLPAWAGRRVFERNGRIDEAAQALGISSLDRAAEIIGWTWR